MLLCRSTEPGTSLYNNSQNSCQFYELFIWEKKLINCSLVELVLKWRLCSLSQALGQRSGLHMQNLTTFVFRWLLSGTRSLDYFLLLPFSWQVFDKWNLTCYCSSCRGCDILNYMFQAQRVCQTLPSFLSHFTPVRQLQQHTYQVPMILEQVVSISRQAV